MSPFHSRRLKRRAGESYTAERTLPFSVLPPSTSFSSRVRVCYIWRPRSFLTSPSTTRKTVPSSPPGSSGRLTSRRLVRCLLPFLRPSFRRLGLRPERGQSRLGSETRGSCARISWRDGSLARVRRRTRWSRRSGGTSRWRAPLEATGSGRGRRERRRWPLCGVRSLGARPISGSSRVTIGGTVSVSGVLALRAWFLMVRASGTVCNVASRFAVESRCWSFPSSCYLFAPSS